jgi:hypothetical protein
MTNLKCNVCGAELLPATSFCRQCGSPATAADTTPESEQPTALFSQTNEAVTTQRLDPRPTSPDRAMRLGPNAQSTAINLRGPGKTERKNMLGRLILLLVIIGIISAVAVEKLRSRPTTIPTASQTSEGSRTIQLATPDPLDRVESWYQNNNKLTKTVRLTSASVVMRNEKVTITLANENNKTVILIKRMA